MLIMAMALVAGSAGQALDNPFNPQAKPTAIDHHRAPRRRGTAPSKPADHAAFYQNCSAARAAGAAPIRRGAPGYSRKLDRDNDGIACE